MKKSILAITMLALFGLIITAGCGGSSDSPPPSIYTISYIDNSDGTTKTEEVNLTEKLLGAYKTGNSVIYELILAVFDKSKLTAPYYVEINGTDLEMYWVATNANVVFSDNDTKLKVYDAIFATISSAFPTSNISGIVEEFNNPQQIFLFYTNSSSTLASTQVSFTITPTPANILTELKMSSFFATVNTANGTPPIEQTEAASATYDANKREVTITIIPTSSGSITEFDAKALAETYYNAFGLAVCGGIKIIYDGAAVTVDYPYNKPW